MPRPTQLMSHKDYTEEITALYTLFNSRPRGSLFTYTEIETVTKLKRPIQPWTTVIDKFRKMFLRETGIALRAEKNVGYRTLTAQQQLEDDSHRRRSERALKKDFAEKIYIKDEDMDEAQQKLQAVLTHQDSQTLQVIRAAASERKTFLASGEGVNRYLQTNAIRPRAILIQDEEDGDGDPPAGGSGGTTPSPGPRPRPRTGR